MKKKLVIFEINECDFSYFLYGAKKFKFPEIKKFLDNKKITKTFTKDKIEGLNLDPWVQWVSVHTGRNSSKHKIFRTGQSLKKNIPQVWENINAKNSSIGLWGLFNSKNRNKKNINFYYPDPWNYSELAFPKDLNSYLILPRYYATNYPNISIIKLLFYGANFFRKIFFSKTIFFLLKNFFSFYRIFKNAKLKSFNLYFFLDLISLSIIKEKMLNKKLSFLIIINSFAYYQHNYWDDNQNEYFYFWYLNEMVKIMNDIKKDFKSSIILNGFSQKKILPEYAIRPKNYKNLLNSLKINFKKINLNMTTGAYIYFKNNFNKYAAIQILTRLNIHNENLFFIENYQNQKKLFIKFNLTFKTNRLNYILKSKNSIKSVYFSKHKIKFLNKNKKLIKNILSECIFLKSTSKHTNNGLMYSENFFNIISFTNKIENHKIYNHIVKFFNNK